MDEQKRPRAWVYARIPGDYDGTMNSYKVCSMQALHDGCDIVGGSIDERGGWLLCPGYRDMMQQIKGGKVDRVLHLPYAADQRQGAPLVLLFQAAHAARHTGHGHRVQFA